MAGFDAIMQYITPGDPNDLFSLEQELAVGSFGTVYKVKILKFFILIPLTVGLGQR